MQQRFLKSLNSDVPSFLHDKSNFSKESYLSILRFNDDFVTINLPDFHLNVRVPFIRYPSAFLSCAQGSLSVSIGRESFSFVCLFAMNPVIQWQIYLNMPFSTLTSWEPNMQLLTHKSSRVNQKYFKENWSVRIHCKLLENVFQVPSNATVCAASSSRLDLRRNGAASPNSVISNSLDMMIIHRSLTRWRQNFTDTLKEDKYLWLHL